MDRRKAFGALGLGALLPFMKAEAKSPSSGQFLIYVELAVGSLSPIKVEAFCNRIKNNMRKGKPDNFHFLIRPDRRHETSISIFSLTNENWFDNEEKNEEWFQKALENAKLVELEPDREEFYRNEYPSDDEVIENTAIQLGAPPVLSLPENFEFDVRHALELAKSMQISRNLKGFVLNYFRIKEKMQDVKLEPMPWKKKGNSGAK